MGLPSSTASPATMSGSNWLSPFDYEPCEAVGGREAERQMLAWVHELGLHIYLWVTTVGIDRDAPRSARTPGLVHPSPQRRACFTPGTPPPARIIVGYAPDADPLSTGWRQLAARSRCAR